MMTHPRTHVAIPAALIFATALVWAPVGHAFYGGGGKDAAKGNDCLIGYNGITESDVTVDGKKQSVSCTDCDPDCDLDGDTTANGSCTFAVGVCINQDGVEGCTPPSALDKASAKGKIKGVKGSGSKVVIDVSQLLTGSECGAFVDVVVPTLKNGAKDGSASFKLKGSVKKNKAEGTPARKDKDKLTYVCVPRAEGEACPVPTTTTSTSTTTSTTVPPCGNGLVDNGEVCDGSAEPTGCPGGETCLPDCSACAPCVAPTTGDPASLTFTTGLGTTACGSPGFSPTPAAPPFGGVLKDSGGATIQNLGLGCLYIGGASSTVPGGVTPDTAPSTFSVEQVCNGGNTLILGGAATGGLDCTVADGPTRYCANGNPGTGNHACTSDDDCRPNCVNNLCVNGAPGSNGSGACVNGSQCGSGAEGTVGIEGLICVPTANCFFGPPLPVKNGPLSTCVQNVFDNDASGTADLATGAVAVSYTLSSRVHFTSTAYPHNPCPICCTAADPDPLKFCPMANVCDAGPNRGLACTGVGVDGTTHDCPPDGFYFLAPLAVSLDPLTTGTSTLPPDGSISPDGFFCPMQGNAGAFTVATARAVAMTGTPAPGGLDTTAKDAVMVSAFCIPRTGNVLIDGAANLPGPGATSLGGTLQLQLVP